MLKDKIKILSRYEVESSEEWNKWGKAIPYLSFNQDHVVKVVPPYGGAIIRFIITHTLLEKKYKDEGIPHISVYLDVFRRLAPIPTPYWEIYPTTNGEALRFELYDTQKLMDAIDKAIAHLLKEYL